MAPSFSIHFTKSKKVLKLIYTVLKEETSGSWEYLGSDLAKESQSKFSLKLDQMAARINGKTFLPQRSLKPLPFPIGNTSEFSFKLSQFGIPIADLIPINENKGSDNSNLVVELVDRKGNLNRQKTGVYILSL